MKHKSDSKTYAKIVSKSVNKTNNKNDYRTFFKTKCPYCDMIFRDSNDVEKHISRKHKDQIKVKTDQNPFYKCPYCNTVFTDFANVENHIANEHKEQLLTNVKCTECKKSLPNDPKIIKNHMMTKHIIPKQKSVDTFIVEDVKDKKLQK